MTERDDPEFKLWSADAQYLFQERLGMMFADTPFEKCDPAGVKLARQQAREFERERREAGIRK